jgi:hypothetical protein
MILYLPHIQRYTTNDPTVLIENNKNMSSKTT